MRNRVLILSFAFLTVVSISCSKEAAIDSRMESIAGVYTLRVSIDDNWTDLSAYGYGMDNPPIGTIVKKNGGWYFDYLLPYPNKDGGIDFADVVQPMTWDPVLDAYCFIGTNLAGPDFSSIGTPMMYFDKASSKLHYDVYDHDVHIYLYVWSKK